ncbi:MAG: VanZ family protein [Clostridiales bacterium]|jgi:glycopeptide antibiotics resistance protein|nr:VanZ family protein [Clostridiales bacterium]
MECAYFMCILPLPDPAKVAKQTGSIVQLIPLAFARDFLKSSGFELTAPGTWLPAIKSSYVFVPLFNVILTVPFGVYLGYYFKQSLKRALVYSLALSLFYEITQLTGLYGIYPRPYRLFDVDDLLLNTLGGVAGYLLYARFRRLLPSKERIDKADEKDSVRVSLLRRFVAFMVDYIPMSFLGALLILLTKLPRATTDILALFAYYLLASLLTGGATLGKRLVRIKLEPNKRSAVTLRYLLRNAGIATLWLSSYWSGIIYDDRQFIPALITEAVILFSLADLIFSFRRDGRLWYERLTKTKNISTWSTEPCNSNKRLRCLDDEKTKTKRADTCRK